jgi:hypothetical protein
VNGAVTRLTELHGISRDIGTRHVEEVLAAFAQAADRSSSRARPPSAAGSVRVLRQWLSLSRRQKLTTAYVAGLVMVVEILVRLCPVDQAARWLRSPLITNDLGALPPLDRSVLSDRELRLLGSLRWVQRLWLWDETCLRRALAAGWLLRRRRPGLCLGLANSENAIAHAWLAVEGQALDALAGTVPLLPVELARLEHG